MVWLAGQRITAARLSQDSDATTLGNDTAAAISTWEDWGTETITFADPGVAVKVWASLSGEVVNGTDLNVVGTIRAAISFDGGSTFTTGNEPNARIGTDNTTRMACQAQHHRSGTPTGSIVVKGQLNTDDLTTAFQNGHLLAMVVPQ